MCRLKNPTVIWLLVGFHPATRSVQSTPADNTRKRVWQYIEKEKERKIKQGLSRFAKRFSYDCCSVPSTSRPITIKHDFYSINWTFTGFTYGPTPYDLHTILARLSSLVEWTSCGLYIRSHTVSHDLVLSLI